MMIVTHLAMVHHRHDIVYKSDITHSSSSVKITNILSFISIILCHSFVFNTTKFDFFLIWCQTIYYLSTFTKTQDIRNDFYICINFYSITSTSEFSSISAQVQQLTGTLLLLDPSRSLIPQTHPSSKEPPSLKNSLTHHNLQSAFCIRIIMCNPTRAILSSPKTLLYLAVPRQLYRWPCH